MSWDEEYAGDFPYAKVRTSVPTGNDGKVILRETDVKENTDVSVTCDQTWCTHEIGVSHRPARIPAPRPVTVKPSGDLAGGRPATASSSVTGSDARPPGLAVDSTKASAWEPADGGDQWWQVDLGKPVRLSRAVLDWDHTALPSAYKLMTSMDGRTWTTATRVGQPHGGEVTHALGDVTARYLRVAVTGRVALWDVQVFGAPIPPSPSPSPSTVVTVASVAPVAASSDPSPPPQVVSSEPGTARFATAWLLITVGVIAVGVGMSQAGVRSAFRYAGLAGRRRGRHRPDW